jgi:hypothetical protein
MADATSTFTVRGRADVDDAVRGLNKVDDAAKKAAAGGESLGSQFKTMAGSIIGAEAAMQLFSAATQFATESVAKAIEADERLAASAADVSSAFTELQVNLGNIIIGGENGAIAMNALADILLDLSDALAGSAEEGSVAVMVVDALREGIIAITYVVDGAVIAWEALKVGITAATAVVYAAGRGVVGLATALADMVQVGIGMAVDGFATLLESSVELARAVGAGGLLPASVDESITSMRGFADSMREGMDPMARLRETGNDIAGTFEVVTDQVEESSRTILDQVDASETLRTSLRDTRAELDLTTTSTRSYARAATEAAQATWEFSDAEAGLKLNADSGAGKQQAMLGLGVDPKMEQAGADALAFAIETKGKIAAALTGGEGEGGGGFFDVQKLEKDYDAMAEATSAFEGTASGLGSSLSSSFGAALGSTENFGKAFKAALGQALVSQGITEILTGISNMIPFGPMFNPVAGAARLAGGSTMLAIGKAMGGKGSAPGGGGGGGGDRSVGESSGMTPMTQPQRQGPTNLIDYTGVTIVTNDTDSMRTLIDRQARTATAGAGSRV